MKVAKRKAIAQCLLIVVLLLSVLSTACSFAQYSDSVDKVLPATVRIIAGNSLGSGVVVGKLGLVLTSNHVVAVSKTAQVFFIDGRGYQGATLLNNEKKDLALIQLEGLGVQFPCANLGNSLESDGLQVGDNLEIIGYPAFTGSDAPVVTGGQISGFPRIEAVQFIQSCAPVYPGNSGGPVINRFGEVIGIVNGKYTNLNDRCATFATAVSEAEILITQANGLGPGEEIASQPAAPQSTCPNVGCRAPDFTFSAPDGKITSFQSLRGKKVLLIFAGDNYYTDSRLIKCLTKVYSAWPRSQLELMLVVPEAKGSEAESWMATSGIKFPVLPDPGREIAKLYNVSGYPAFYFVNAYADIKIKRMPAAGLCYEEIDALLRLF